MSWPSPPNELSLLRSRLLREGRRILDWSDSNPRNNLPLEGLEAEDPARLFASPGNLRYDPDPRGLRSARAALAERPGPGILRDPEAYFLTASTSEAYSWLFKLLCDPGDLVLVPRPGYPLFDYLAGLESVRTLPWRLEYLHPRGWRTDFDSVEAALSAARALGRPRAIVLINPNNPTGSFIEGEERARFVELAAREGLALIVDEVFLPFPVEGRGRSFAGETDCLCFVLDGLSKSLCLPQFKLGWIGASGPPALVAEALERLETIADTYLSAGAPAMNALPALLERAPRLAAALGGRLAANLATLRAGLEGPSSPHRVYRCEGGWTALVESPRYQPEEEVAARLLGEAGLWSQPGHFFDLEREAVFTASLILPPERFEEGLRRYKSWYDAASGA